MIATVSVHNGSSVARQHNLRNPKVVDKEKHIRKDGVHETWVDVPPRRAYKEIFGDAVERFNRKQTRRDRKIMDYYDHVLGDKQKHAVYEIIAGVYPKPDMVDTDEVMERIAMNQLGGGNEKREYTHDELKGILREYINGWAERNPQLRVIGVYYHDDEEGEYPHIHIDYVPVATGYKRGPDTQNALTNALNQQGYKFKNTHNTGQIQLEAAERQALAEICKKHDLNIIHPQEGNGVKHLDTDAYKEAKKAEEEAIKKRKSAEQAAREAKKQQEAAEQAAREANRQLEQLRRDVADERKKEQEAKENTRNAEADMRNAEAKAKELEGKIEKLNSEIASRETTKGKLERDNAMLDAAAEKKSLSMMTKDIPAMKQAIADAESELARQYRPRSRGR